MADLEALLQEIDRRVQAIAEEGPQREDLPSFIDITMRLQLGSLVEACVSAIGRDPLIHFFSECEPANESFESRLESVLGRIILRCCSESTDPWLRLDSSFLWSELRSFAHAVDTGSVGYTFSYRIINVDITSPFELAPGIDVVKVSDADLDARYPGAAPWISHEAAQYLRKHSVEAQESGSARPSEIDRMQSTEEVDARVRSIEHAFLLGTLDVQLRFPPSVCQMHYSSQLAGSNTFLRLGPLMKEPTLLDEDSIANVCRAFAVLQSARTDRVLAAATDRFVLAKKRPLHHPNRVNEPNWDRVVDYVIGLEALFLTAGGDALSQELSYRFSINGALAMRSATGIKPQVAQRALKQLYDLRSCTVHGASRGKALKCAERFLGVLTFDDEEKRHDLGRLMLVSEVVQGWCWSLLQWLHEIPQAERPYLQSNGWEELLWRPE